MNPTLDRLIVIVFILFVGCTPVLADKRVALVIGNSDYFSIPRIEKPQGDAVALAKTLKLIGFDKITLKTNLTHRELDQVLGQFSRDAAGADIALIYFAGHGIEITGINYLIPTDAVFQHIDDVSAQAVRLDNLMTALDQVKKLKLIILDACRDNPFKQVMNGSSANHDLGRGFARIYEASDNTYVAFAAKPGTVADDGDGANSPYTTALLNHIATPNIDVRVMFGKVRDEVLRTTMRQQDPSNYSSIGDDTIFLH